MLNMSAVSTKSSANTAKDAITTASAAARATSAPTEAVTWLKFWMTTSCPPPYWLFNAATTVAFVASFISRERIDSPSVPSGWTSGLAISTVPEIPAGSAGSAIALVSGLLLMFSGRRK